MCGIAGFVGTGDLELLKKMTDSIAYRGPDDEGHWQEEERGVFLGQRRLSILDLSGGHQPMFSADRDLVIIFNGEIYNHAEIRSELVACGHKFQTDHSDTEVIIYAYRQWGDSCVERFNGMWAFVIYDRKAGKLFASRDRFGKKPFFYALINDNFVFGSELHLLRYHPAVKTKISKKALQKYFAYNYIPAPHTLYESIYKLPGGHSLTFDLSRRTIQIKQYWSYVLEPFENIPKNPEEEWGEEIRRLLGQAVERRMIADVPIGIFLSGGIDSSAITAFAARQSGAENKIKTFSIGFTEKSYDESEYAKRVADEFNTEHHLEIFSMEKALELLPQVIEKLDEPMGDNSILPTYLLSRFTRQHVTVALGGDAGDELFAGYDPFVALKYAKLYSALVPGKVHHAIEFLVQRLPVSHRNMSLDFRIKRTLRGLSYPPRLWTPVWMSSLAPDELNDLFNEELDLEELYSEAITAWESCAQDNLVDRVTQYFIQTYLQDDILVKVDRASMWNSLEARSPFLDIDFVNFARRIPAAYRFRNGQTKYILKKALEPVLPHEILYRRKKGFGIPIGKYIIDGNIEFNYPAPLLNHNFLQERLHSHRTLKRDDRAFLWNSWVYLNYAEKHQIETV